MVWVTPNGSIHEALPSGKKKTLSVGSSAETLHHFEPYEFLQT
ncbi:hypothetical protein [Sulfitobacter sp. NFXS29]